jgi:HK97 family phage prohead protease
VRKLKAEIRADGLHISGYVNVTEKMSRPVITGKGQKVIEVIEPRAFEKALERTENAKMTKDHDENYVLSERRAKTLDLYEDAIGLHYDALISDAQTITEARAGKLKGLSFGMKNIVDTVEERANALPLRRVSALDLDHITLAVNKIPVYAATSIEIRADEETSEIEIRAIEETPKIVEPKPDNSDYKNRISELKKIGGKYES